MPFCGETTVLPSFESLYQLFQASVFRAPLSIAAIDVNSEESITYNELSIKVNKLSRFLCTILENGDPSVDVYADRVIAVCIPPSIDLIVSLLAILQIKGAYLPLDIDFPSSRVSHILDDAKPRLLLTKGDQPAVADLKTNYTGDVKLFDLDEVESKIDCEDGGILDGTKIEATTDRLVAILYTSGSTGTPKGVRIPQRAVLNRLFWQWKMFPYEENEVCCFKTSLTFVDSISEIFGPLLTGHQLVIVPKSMTKNVENLLEVLESFKIHRLVLVPTLLRSILLLAERRRPSLPDLKLWICSGEIFPPDLLYSFFETFKNNQRICNFYGSTEVMGDVTFIQFTSSDEVLEFLGISKVPIGMPIYNTEIYLMDKEMNEVIEDGKVGEMFVAGLNLAEGYVGETSSSKFVENPYSSGIGYSVLYRTGDYARYTKGQLLYEGRTDSQLKVRGHRVDVSEVEATIQGIKEISKCSVLCYHPGEIDQALIAFYTSDNTSITPDYMMDRISTMLPSYMHPQFIKTDEMPLLVNGKVDRQRLIKSYENHDISYTTDEVDCDLSNCEEGKEEIAKTFLQILRRILGHAAPPKFSLDQNFFQIGGNSLNSILVITSLQDSGFRIGVTEFLEANTLQDILKKIIPVEDNLLDENKAFINRPCEKQESSAYQFQPFSAELKEEIKRIINKSFVSKGDLEILLNIRENEFSNIFEQIWKTVFEQDLSFVVVREEGEKIVAASINTDLFAGPEILPPTKNIKYILDFLESCEAKVRYSLPEGQGKVMHSLLMATDENVSPAENVILVREMEEQNYRVAFTKGYEAIFTTNTSDLTRHVCGDLLSYKILSTNQVNKWIAEDGTRPFRAASNDQVAECSVLYVSGREV